VPYDIVEFTYIPNSPSSFDVSGVNAFVVPMTMTPQQMPLLGSVGIQPIKSNPTDPTYTNISRQMIGTAYTQFMTHDLQGGPEFQRLLYGSSVPHPADPCYATAPSAPDNQFFAIVNPWFWINQNNTCDPQTSFWNNYWNVVLDEFFKDGNKLKVNVGGVDEYTGTCVMDNGVLTYTFKDGADSDVLNTACTSPGRVLKLPKPSSTVPSGDPYVSQAAKLLFGNTAEFFCQGTCCKFPDGDGGQIIDAILQAFNRGVALDGLNPQLIPIASAKTTSFVLPAPGSNPLAIATITTTSPHGMPLGPLNASYNVNISGCNVSGYNGIQPSAAAYLITVLSPTVFTFPYVLGTLATPNSPIDSITRSTDGINSAVALSSAPLSAITVGEHVYINSPTNSAGYHGEYTVMAITDATHFSIQASFTSNTSGGICWRGFSAAGPGGTATPVGASSIAWNNSNNWYAPANPSHQAQAYNTYSKFLHYSTIEGTDSRLGGTPIFIDNRAYGFSLDETPTGPYPGQPVSPKFDTQIQDGSTINLTLSPWRFTPTNP
jgi:hypothetical protein